LAPQADAVLEGAMQDPLIAQQPLQLADEQVGVVD
jgi:hypothetical protein